MLKRAKTGKIERLRDAVRDALPAELRAMIREIEREAANPQAALRFSIRMAALCVIATLLLSHALWFQTDRLYLPAPVFDVLGDLPPWLNPLLYVAMLLLSAVLLFLPQMRWIGFVLPPVFLLLAAQDQLRGQFSLYMCMFNLLVAACLPLKITDRHLDPLRYMVCGVYFWAGIYKINRYFIYALFPWFVATWFPFHAAAQAFGFVAPLLEAGVGICLFLPRLRWIGQVVACCMLAVVFLSIGPVGHNQAMGVWPVNVYLDGMAVFLFMHDRPLWDIKELKKPLAALGAFLFLLLPALGGLELLGHHPSFKLYCCAQFGEVQFAKKEDLSFLPDAVRRRVTPDRRLSGSAITMGLFEVGASPLIPGDAAFLTSIRGFCPYLKAPGQTVARVGDLTHFWSDELEERDYAFCDPKGPRLVCTSKNILQPDTGGVLVGPCKAP